MKNTLKNILCTSAISLALVASLNSATAAPITVGNYSFTSPDLPGDSVNYDSSQTVEEYSLVPGLGGVGPPGTSGGGGATNNYVPDWVVATNGGVAGVDNPVAFMYAGTGGSSSDGLLPGTAAGYTDAIINLSTGQSGSFTYSGGLGYFTVGATYNLTLAIGQRLDTPVSNFYQVELFDGATLVGSSAVSTATSGTFTDISLTTPYVGVDTGLIGIEILTSYNSAGPGFEQANFDNVRLTQTPEPSTWAMMLAGLAFLGFCVRRKGNSVRY